MALAWRTAQHGKDEVLRFFTEYLDDFPIPEPTDAACREAGSAVHRLREIAKQRQAGRQAVLNWLRMEFGIDKPTQKLADVAALNAEELTGEVKKWGGKKAPLTVAQVKFMADAHATSVVPLQKLAVEAGQLEYRVAELVNRAYGLTSSEVKVIWDTAPPRMPTARSAGV